MGSNSGAAGALGRSWNCTRIVVRIQYLKAYENSIKYHRNEKTAFYNRKPSHKTSLVAQMVKRLPTMQETQVRSLRQEDPLEKDPTPVLLPGKSHGQRSLVGYSPWGHKESDTTE